MGGNSARLSYSTGTVRDESTTVPDSRIRATRTDGWRSETRIVTQRQMANPTTTAADAAVACAISAPNKTTFMSSLPAALWGYEFTRRQRDFRTKDRRARAIR